MSEEKTDYITEVDEALHLLRGDRVVEFGKTGRELIETEDGSVFFSRGGAWVKLHTSFRNRLLGVLKGSKLSVFLCISLHIDDRNECYPTIETIASETNLSEREVKYAIQELESMGLIGVSREHRKANTYVVNRMVSYGNGNDPLGEVSAPKENVAKCTQTMSQNAPQEEPYKKNQYIPPAAASSSPAGQTECEIPFGMNERTAKGLRFGCSFCATPGVITWENETCPNCGAVIVWKGNKWLEKRQDAQRKQAKAADRGVARHKNRDIQFVQDLCNAKVSPEEEGPMLAYIAQNGSDAFHKMCSAIYATDKGEGKFGRAIVRHIANAAPYYGKDGKKKQQAPASDVPVVPNNEPRLEAKVEMTPELEAWLNG